MESIFIKIKNLIPYFVLIAIYFFFVNIEASKNLNSIKTYDPNKLTKKENVETLSNNLIINIPVIPYSQ